MKHYLSLQLLTIILFSCSLEVNNLPCIFGEWKVVSIKNNSEPNSDGDFSTLLRTIQPGTKITFKEDILEIIHLEKNRDTLFFDHLPDSIVLYDQQKTKKEMAKIEMKNDSLTLTFVNTSVFFAR